MGVQKICVMPSWSSNKTAMLLLMVKEGVLGLNAGLVQLFRFAAGPLGCHLLKQRTERHVIAIQSSDVLR